MSAPAALAPHDRDLLAQVLPGYEIGEVLGRGASGVVVAGRHRRLGRDVALKQLTPGFGVGAPAAERFLAEARTLAALDHPNVVRLYDFVELDGQGVLVMERLTSHNPQHLRTPPLVRCQTTFAGFEHALDAPGGVLDRSRAGGTPRDLRPGPPRR